MRPKVATANNESRTFINMAVKSKSTLKGGRISTMPQNGNLIRRIEKPFVRSHKISEINEVNVVVIAMRRGQ